MAISGTERVDQEIATVILDYLRQYPDKELLQSSIGTAVYYNLGRKTALDYTFLYKLAQDGILSLKEAFDMCGYHIKWPSTKMEELTKEIDNLSDDEFERVLALVEMSIPEIAEQLMSRNTFLPTKRARETLDCVYPGRKWMETELGNCISESEWMNRSMSFRTSSLVVLAQVAELSPHFVFAVNEDVVLLAKKPRTEKFISMYSFLAPKLKEAIYQAILYR